MAAQKMTFWILTFMLCTLTHSEVIESDAPKESSAAIDANNEAPYSAVGKETGSDVITSGVEDTAEPATPASTTPEPVRSYKCRPYGYCKATPFPYEVTLQGQGWSKTFSCQQGVDPLQHCCLPVTKHYICYNITVKDEGRLSLGDGSPKHETDFSALCGLMLETLNHTMGRYSYVSKEPGGAGVVYRHATWQKITAKDSHIIQDLACEYDVEDEDSEEDDVTDNVTITTQSPEEEDEEEEEDDDEDEEEREKKEREKEEGGSDGGGGDGGERREPKEEDEDDEEIEEEEEPPKAKKKPKKKGRRN